MLDIVANTVLQFINQDVHFFLENNQLYAPI